MMPDSSPTAPGVVCRSVDDVQVAVGPNDLTIWVGDGAPLVLEPITAHALLTCLSAPGVRRIVNKLWLRAQHELASQHAAAAD